MYVDPIGFNSQHELGYALYIGGRNILCYGHSMNKVHADPSASYTMDKFKW